MKLNTYQKVGIATIGATLFLIFVGVLVRVSGSGLGCPDWPRCFGSWVPPTSAGDLPASYNPAHFNIYRTWTEYINRLFGVITGLLITATFILSFRYRKSKPAVLYSSTAAFVMVLIQGWLGGKVVESGLQEWLITAHLVLALAIICALLYAVFEATGEEWLLKLNNQSQRWLVWAGSFLLIFTLAQIILGAQLRGAIDQVKTAAAIPREAWVGSAGYIAEIHRSFAWTILVGGGLIFYICLWKTDTDFFKKMGVGLLGVIILQIILGVGLYYLALPPVYQILHLVGAALLVCVEFILLLLVNKAESVSI